MVGHNNKLRAKLREELHRIDNTSRLLEQTTLTDQGIDQTVQEVQMKSKICS
ncbi:hypothetical protein K443DRAFT_672530 [Laccaria amethystina LaAM-08-1]|jgi:hypothetical protein|uniref:Uncharacterized protein n=1 Tax=Laccaria amethystina LaAM-08-1 TaxID=1095629 RepID=A0A0C9YDR9_9AGAR|nr:hypothetical protein K443DRAFT_672530 [Laccaria amethystina LaAM-08-1]